MKARLKYDMPQLEIINLTPTDILTTSTDAFDGAWVPIGENGEDDQIPML